MSLLDFELLTYYCFMQRFRFYLCGLFSLRCVEPPILVCFARGGELCVVCGVCCSV